MATQQIVSSAVQSQKSAVVTFPQLPNPQISQVELGLLLALRGRLHQLEAQVEAAERSIKARLECGAELEPGDHRAELKESFRRNVSWKDVVIRLAERLKMDGEAYCSKVLASTKPSRTISLIVE
jgi:hypothetical protein